MRIGVSSEAALSSAVVFEGETPVSSIGPDVDDPSTRVIDWLARLRLLHGIPFEYLVPDDGLLRPETIRFFHLDRNWTDAICDGAIAAGTFGTRDRSRLQAEHAAVRALVDDAERDQWIDPPTSAAAEANVSGFLLRSRAVSGWPGLVVRAFTVRGERSTPIDVLRIERLAPAVLLALFADIPDRVEVEEPRQGVQFGVRTRRDEDPSSSALPGSWFIDVRDPTQAADPDVANAGEVDGVPVPVPFRRGSAGVVHMGELRRRIETHPSGVVGTNLDAAELALQLIRLPYRQEFGASSEPVDRFLKVDIDDAAVRAWFRTGGGS